MNGCATVWAVGLVLVGACGAASATPVHRIDEYAAASQAARTAGAMLLVSVEPGPLSAADPVGVRLDAPELQQRFAGADQPWVLCRVPLEAAAEIVRDPALAAMRHGPGVFVVDYAHEAWLGRITSVLPRSPGDHYRFAPDHLDELVDLPAGSLTQRSLILAVRVHPETPRSTAGACDPTLATAAAAHSSHQARIRQQGHHDWETRSRRLGGALAEVCAQSWEDVDLLDACVDCVASWRQSSGHWRSVAANHTAYGYDIRRGGDGIWYATGLFRD